MGRISQRIDETVEVHDVPYRGTEPDPVAVERSGHQSAALAFARLLWEQRARLAKATVAGLVIAAVGTLLIPNRYQAVIQLMPPDGNSLSGGMGTLTALMGMSRLGSGSGSPGGLVGGLGEVLGGGKVGALFIGVLESRTVADRIIDRFDLRKIYWLKTYTSARQKLASRTIIDEDKRTGIIQIAVEDHDRERAVAIAQAYVSELDRLLAQVNTSAASRERAFLEQRLSLADAQLENDSKKLSQFSSKNATLDPQAQGKAMVEAAAVLQGQLIAAQSELSGLEQIYTTENVRIRSLKAHIAELQNQLNKLDGKNYSGATTLDSADLYPSLRQLPVLGLEYADLYRRVKVDEGVFELLTKEYELAKVQEAKETPVVKVLDAARLPEKRSWPPRGWLTAVGAVLGFLLGSCWIVGKELWNEIDSAEPHKEFLSNICRETWAWIAETRWQIRSRLSKVRGPGNSPTSRSD
jgi:uncharacterized protein involved in exopolysaccharide biosynthesis